MFSEKLLRHYVASLRLLRALVVKCTRSYSICGKISYHHFLVVIFLGLTLLEKLLVLLYAGRE